MMSSFSVDIDYKSYNKHRELLCGDSVEMVKTDDNMTVLVLADGLGSGVKANILSKITAKIISTMMANNLSVEDCVNTVAATLPICEVRKIAYSTFTIIRINNDLDAEVIQFDNPHAFLLRDGVESHFSEIAETIDGKTIYKSRISLRENDVIMAMSDGVVHAGVGGKLNFGWQRNDIINYMERVYKKEYTAKMLTTILAEQCLLLYDNEPGDDTTICTVKVRRRSPVNLLIGPPAERGDVDAMMSLFFSKEGKHIVCGGTTSQIAAEFLGKPLEIGFPNYVDPKIPPTAKIEGVDLVTEGVITINRVLDIARNYLNDNDQYSVWNSAKDGASTIARMLIEEATDINFYVGRAVNPAHQNPDLPISFNIKMRLVDELVEALKSMGKQIKVSYF